MRQYNIYAGLGGSFGGCTYMYTGLYDNEDDASDDAFQEACDLYESYEGNHGLWDFDDAINEFCEQEGADRDNLTDDDFDIINEMYKDAREGWLDYKAVPTSEDNIKEEDLILNYIIEDDSSSQTDSE